MPPFILDLLIKFRSQIIIAIVIIASVVGLYLWHISIVEAARYEVTSERNNYWTEYIKGAPKETVAVKIQLPVLPPKVIVVHDTTVDAASLAAALHVIDSLARENAAIAGFLRTFEGNFTDSLKWANHRVVADPRQRTLVDYLTYAPASVPGIQINNLVPVPYNKWGLVATVNIPGQISAGLDYRVSGAITIGAEYQVSGPTLGTVKYERAHARFVWHFN